MTEQSKNYLKQAPDSYEKYNRDLETYWSNLQKQTASFDMIISDLKVRKLSAELLGHDSTIYCNFDDRSQLQLTKTYNVWKSFLQGLDEKLGEDKENPRLTWGAEFIANNGQELQDSTQRLSIAFQFMMEGQLNKIQIAQWFTVFVGLISLIIIIWVIQKGLITPLGKTLQGFNKVAQGDLSHQVSVQNDNEIGDMVHSFNHLLDRLNSMFRLTETINKGTKLDEMVCFIYQEFQAFVPIDWVGVFISSADGQRMILERSHSSDNTQCLNAQEFLIEGSIFEQVITQKCPIVLNSKTASQQASIFKSADKNSVFLPLRSAEEYAAVMVFASKDTEYQQSHITFLNNISATLSHVLDKTIVVEDLVSAAINGLAKLAESRDPETGDHLVRMAHYSAIIAEELGRESAYKDQISPQFVRDVYHFAPMHDIGKVGIADAILLKPGRLDADERTEMERHPVIGAEVLRKSEQQLETRGHSVFNVGIEIAEAHHEKFDGTGYPYQLVGEVIPLSARIVTVADVFDALTSKRPYKEAWPVEKAISVMEQDAGSHFDPEVIAAFKSALPNVMEIYNRLKHV